MTTNSRRETAVVVIPTRNEENTIRGVIAEVREAFTELPYDVEVLITDDSTDSTRAIARECGAHVVNGGGEGLGSAMYRGLKEALYLDPGVILSIDGDGQTDARAEISGPSGFSVGRDRGPRSESRSPS